MIVSNPPVSNILPWADVHITLLEVTIGGIVGLYHLIQRDGQLFLAVVGLTKQLFDGRVDMDRVLGRGVHINHLLDRSLL